MFLLLEVICVAGHVSMAGPMRGGRLFDVFITYLPLRVWQAI